MGPPLNFPPRLRALARHIKFSGNRLVPGSTLRYGWLVTNDGWLTDAEKDWLRSAGFVGHGRKWQRPDDLSWAARDALIPLWGWETREVRQSPPFCDYLMGSEIQRRFTAADVVALGKQCWWGDARILLFVRLKTGEILSVNASKQEDAGRRWIMALSRGLPAPIPSRETQIRLAWLDT